MFSYWFQAAFKDTKNKVLAKLPLVAMYSANFTLAFLLFIRWVESGHFPLSNLYESLIFLSWSLTSIHLFLENVVLRSKDEQLTPILTLGAITSPLCLFTNAFATFSLPQEMQKVTVLVPALQSNWLIMHVSVMIISYAALLSGSLLAMAFLVSRFVENTKISGNIPFNIHMISFRNAAYPVSFTPYSSQLPALPQTTSTTSTTFGGKGGKGGTGACETEVVKQALPKIGHVEPVMQSGNVDSAEKMNNKTSTFQKNLSQTLDNLSYRSIGLGFAFLTIGILSGAVWANEAWGSYWSWDPKETWAFVTWLVFAFYLHTRLSKGWVGKESAFVATFGFAIIWFCYLGVNLFGKGLHSYGWFQTIR